ncbi:hypothetical protein M5K25_009306 [Dendrobium thyrsiflorum]|uniref:Uncharacterized protein n=1 Tax=Dendrobium thyrsiflorum TaxID=117978 RepID=A0ABD0VC54_DENTH
MLGRSFRSDNDEAGFVHVPWMALACFGNLGGSLLPFPKSDRPDDLDWLLTSMKEELDRLRENRPKIQVVVDFASSQKEISDQNR